MTSKMLEKALEAWAAGDVAGAEYQVKSHLEAHPESAAGLHLLGIVYSARGEHSKAIALIERSVHVQPQAEACLNLSKLYAAEGRLEHAIAIVRRAIAMAPSSVEVNEFYAELLFRCGRTAEAVRVYSEILNDDSSRLSTRVNLAIALASRGDYLASARHFDIAVNSFGAEIEMFKQYGDMLQIAGKLEDALRIYHSGMKKFNANSDFLNAVGTVLLKLNRLGEAISYFEHSLREEPKKVEVIKNLAVAKHRSGQYLDAVKLLNSALEIAPDDVECRYNRASTYVEIGRFHEALADYVAVLRSSPQHFRARLNLGLLHLRLGNFKDGWPLFETRLLLKKPVVAAAGEVLSTVPRWEGKGPSSGCRKLVVLAEEGLGDIIQFVRFLIPLYDRGFDVVLLVPSTLNSLIKRSMKMVTVTSSWCDCAGADAWIELLSVPFFLGADLESIPSGKIPYLTADESLCVTWNQRLGSKNSKRVAVMWRGRDNPALPGRSMPLERLIRAMPRAIQLVSLQQSLTSDERALAASSGMIWHDGAEVTWEDAAAIIQNSDIVISIDTGMAHLAGALGANTMVLLPHRADWRWGEARNDSRWYTTMMLHRQPTPQHWDLGFLGSMPADIAN